MDLPLWHWNVITYVLENKINVVSELSRNWNNGGIFGIGSFDEILNLIEILLGISFFVENQINFILQNYYLIKIHNLNSSKMFHCLGLRAIHFR